MKKFKVLLIMIPIIIAVLAYSIVKKDYIMFGILAVSSSAFLYVFISLIQKKERSDIPMCDVFFLPGFVLLMIELRTIITDDMTFFLIFCAFIMMAIPVSILLSNYFSVKNSKEVHTSDTENKYEDLGTKK